MNRAALLLVAAAALVGCSHDNSSESPKTAPEQQSAPQVQAPAANPAPTQPPPAPSAPEAKSSPAQPTPPPAPEAKPAPENPKPSADNTAPTPPAPSADAAAHEGEPKNYLEFNKDGKTYVVAYVKTLHQIQKGQLPDNLDEKTSFGPDGETVVFEKDNGDLEKQLMADYQKQHPKK